jgi:opacity protein-like surface antigen
MRREITDDRKETSVGVKWILITMAVLTAVGLTKAASGTEVLGSYAGSYVELKGGVYSPSSSFDFGNLDLETTFAGDTKTGVNGEIAIGHYVLPTFALELGLGYFKGTGSFEAENPTEPRHQVDFNVIPLILSAKAFIPAGPVAPYGELGLGAYFTKFNVTDNLNTFDGSTTFGLHAGAGLNVNVSPSLFLGLEGRYVWANPSFGDQKIKLNDTEYALNGFELNGFTTTLGLGYRF